VFVVCSFIVVAVSFVEFIVAVVVIRVVTRVAVIIARFGGTTVVVAVIFIACAVFAIVADSENHCKWGAGQV